MSPDWAARFDLVVMWRDNDAARAIKEIDPDTIVLPTEDWNVGGPMRHDFPLEYAVQRADSLPIEVYCSGCGEYLADFTDCRLGPEGCGVREDRRFTDALIDEIVAQADGPYDGISTDGFWNNPGPWGPPRGGLDLDRNGADDIDEHGWDWVYEQWTMATESFLERLWERLGSDNVLVINSGSFHGWYWEMHNGPLLEGAWAIRGNWGGFLHRYRTWMQEAREPHLLVVDGKTSFEVDHQPEDDESYLQLMRFLLGTTMLGDGYFEFSDASGGSHDFVRYYDELDLDIGYPTTDPIEIHDHVFVRFFTGGALLLNATSGAVDVRDADLRPLEGYEGPYWRFAGGQDPVHNDGSEFDGITLAGLSGRDENGSDVFVGDAIVLTRAPADVVADIIIDDRRSGTTPGSSAARRSGDWTGIAGCWRNVNRAWHVGPPWCDGAHGHNSHSAEPGDGSTFVEYTPTIGLTGTYEVSFFHGSLGEEASGLPASDMPCRIEHADGQDLVRIDLTSGVGQWTSLGEYRFETGTSGRVTCTNEASGVVIADAVRFAFFSR